MSNGFKVQHSYQAPFRPKMFVFHDPSKVLQRVHRIEKNAWLHQNVDREAQQMTTDMNL